jgi:hypothetical protein
MTGHDDLIHTTGQAHCPYDERLVGSSGVEYLCATHPREDHDEFCEKTERNQ